MDFGHYERFLGVTCEGNWNLTMGRVFDEIRKKERRGDYLGQTVQMIPHVSNFIRDHLLKVGEKSKTDIVLVEIGGTIGDIENELYIDAVRSLARKVGRENVLFVHLTYVPIPHGVNEQKSKPTQQSVNLLRQKGVEPDIVIARCSEMLTDSVKGKIAKFGNLEKDCVFTGIDVNDVYKIPLGFEEQGMSQLIARKLNMPVRVDLEKWRRLIEKRERASGEIVIAIAGKYTSLEDSYASIIEALKHCEANLGVRIKVKWIDSENGGLDVLDEVDGVIVPGGFGARGTEGKIDVVSYCRKNGVPFLGICYGLQMAVIEFARNVCGLKGANSAEVDKEAKHLVVDILEEQKGVENKGGTMRLGSCVAYIKEGSRVFDLYGSDEVSERHRHRFEVNPVYHEELEKNGLILSGISPDGKLVEFIELKDHPYFVATQGHPELKSSLLKPAPLFMGFIQACMKNEKSIC
jgi:CTP synthase